MFIKCNLIIIHCVNSNECPELYVQKLVVDPKRGAMLTSVHDSLRREIACDVDIGQPAVQHHPN